MRAQNGAPCNTMSGSVAGTPRPGAAALNNMALLKAESRIFKVPAVPKNNKKTRAAKSKVLEEDLYNECIGRIIQRDFFPDTGRLHAQNAYLEADENHDYVRLQEITRKYSGARPPTDPCATPATFDTPRDRPCSPAATARSAGEGDTVRRVPDVPEPTLEQDIVSRHSLDSFLSRHTSEDNSSYDRVIALEERKRAARSASQFEAERTSAALAAAALAVPSIEAQADQTERPHELDTWTYKAKNFIMYVPDGSEQPAPAKPELQHRNTRLRGDPFNARASKQMLSEIAKAQGATKSGKIGVDGTCAGAPRSLVATPSPRPGGAGDESPLMTWGEIEGTPFRLDGGDTPLPAAGAGAAYKMLEWGARERIGLKLAEQAAKKRRPTTPRVRTPTPRTSTERLASMSPAARKLAAKHLKTPRSKLTPATMGVSTTTPKLRTPRLVSSRTPTPKLRGDTDTNDLTDNLLQINVARRTRLKAQDFFR